MRITIDIDEESLRRIQEATGERKMSPAVSKVIEAFLLDLGRREFVESVRRGELEFPMTNDELEAMFERASADRHFSLD